MNYLTLINKYNPIKERYYKTLELDKYYNAWNEPIKIEKETLQAYLELEKFLKQKEIIIGIDSCYRTIEEQERLYKKFLEKYGKDYADSIVSQKKTSEHHTGLAIDLTIKKENKFLDKNEDLILNENIFLEIHKYLKAFGFILRYPKNKKIITSYSYEPWHIRYVGKIPAKIITENNLTLEEYLTNFGGVLVVNKEKNMTSRDVVNRVGKILGLKKIGHTGTLDPMAEGVLVLTIGKATKLGELLTSLYKEYIAGVEVGMLTDTLDTTGKVILEKECTEKINYKQLIKSFHKTYQQEVPIYSAVKINGKKLYEYARNNEKVELPKKTVTIKEIKLLNFNNNSFQFQCLVSKGTYIRSLIRDMGDSINQYFSMSSLTRTKQGNFSINDSYSLKDLENNKFNILSIEDVLPNYPKIDMDSCLYKKIINGCKINNSFNIKDKVIFKYNNKLIAIYQVDNDALKIWKMLV